MGFMVRVFFNNKYGGGGVDGVWWVGRIECTYEPAMTKAFLHGRTEAIRTVQPHTVEFIKVWRSISSPGLVLMMLMMMWDRRFSRTRRLHRRSLRSGTRVRDTSG